MLIKTGSVVLKLTKKIYFLKNIESFKFYMYLHRLQDI